MIIKSFLTALGVILPIMVMLFCGFVLKKLGYINKDLVSKVNKLIFRLFLPVSLFENCYSSQLRVSGNMKMIIFCCFSILVMFMLYIPISKATSSIDSRRSVILQAAFRGNLAMFGVPVLTLLYDGNNLGVMAILLAFMIPELNVLAVLCFEVFTGKKSDFRQILKRIITNPLIDAIALGIIFNLLRIDLPEFVCTSIDKIAGVTTPLTFVMLGASFSFTSVKDNKKDLCVALIGKLVILPLIAILIGISLGLRGPLLASAVTLFGSPVAVSSVPMAEEMGGDFQLASEAVIVSTVLGVFTMFCWIFIMSYFQLL